MEASDAVVITLPGTPDTAIAGLESQLRQLNGVEAAIPGETRGLPAADGAVIILKINQDALSATPQLVAVLDSAIELLRNRNITRATITLPNGTVVAVTASMSEEEVDSTLQEAVKAAPDFEVAMSFADEDRPYVRRVVEALRQRHVRVFYDADHGVALWGQDLVAVLDDVYRYRSQYVVIFVSEHYVRKHWPRHELRSALARAIREKREYVLPACFDDSDVPGLPPTVRHVDCRQTTPDELAEMISRKLGR